MRLTWRTPAAIVLTAGVLVASCTSGSASTTAGAETPQSDSTPTASTQTAAQAAAAAKPNWTSYHGNRARTGVSTSMPAVSGAPTVTKKVKLDGAVYASPIVVNGVTIVATENDSVYALSSTGKQLWHKKLGTPAPQSQLPCGDIFPLGITGTPTYLPSKGLIYVLAELGSPVRHRLFAIHATTGKVSWHKIVDLPGVTASAMQERGALTIAGTHVYVPFGGLAGDCGNYKGRVTAVGLTGSHHVSTFTVPTAREGGIWSPPGATRDAKGHLYVAVGNGASGVGDKYDHSDSVIELSGTKRISSFSPTTWATDNDADLDLGSQGPALVGTKWVFIAGKSGEGYVLKQGHLGGIGGQVSKTSVCQSFGGTAVVGKVVYVPCTDGVRAISIGSTGKITKLWRATSTINGAPVVGGGRVWSLNPSSGVLHELDPKTGASKGSVSVGVTSRFATPAIAGRNLIVPTLTGVTIVASS